MDKTGNPAFSESAMSRIGAVKGAKTMSVGRTYFKTFLLLIVVALAGVAAWEWTKSSVLTDGVHWFPLWGASLVTLFLGLIISFNPRSARVLSIPYALVQGALLGVMSGIFAEVYDGIVGQAIFATLAVFLTVLAGYSLGILRATPKFVAVILIALVSISLFYVFAFIFSLFSISTPLIYSSGPWGIAFSVVVVIVAALSLVIDFDFIDTAAKEKYPKYFEWYGAYGLMVGLIWLYVEILRLLAKLAASRN